MEDVKPFYDKRFNQWYINYTPTGGGYAAVWADTKEECIERYKITSKSKQKE